MTAVEQLRTTLAALSLTAIDARLEGLLESASKKEPSYADFLLEVMNTKPMHGGSATSRPGCSWPICPM